MKNYSFIPKNGSFLLVFLIGALLTIHGCKKEPITTHVIPSVFKYYLYDYDHTVTMSRVLINNTPRNCSYIGQFLDESGLISIDSLLVNNRLLDQGVSGAYEEFLYSPEVENFSSRFDELDGKLVGIRFVDDTLVEYSEIYSPSNLTFSTDQNLASIDKNSNLTITWNADTNNDYDEISIALISRMLIDGEVEESTKDLHYVVLTDDDGSYSIPYSEFNSWPDGLLVEITLVRANQKLMPNSRTLITSFVTSTQMGNIAQ